MEGLMYQKFEMSGIFMSSSMESRLEHLVHVL